jgi:membrane peptidoglycan carboxypeptidase
MYRDAVAEMPLSEKVAVIRSADGYCPIEYISPDLCTAIISVEDKRFESHIGFDLLSFLKASVLNIINLEITGGGSTITQQLAKNMYFTQEQTYTRKVAELLVAFDIERRYEKDEILELYLNIIYFGQGQTGITAACRHYFDCSPSELSFEQVLYIAGLPQAPSVYSTDPVKGEQRAKKVLEAMIKNGYEYEPQEG